MWILPSCLAIQLQLHTTGGNHAAKTNRRRTHTVYAGKHVCMLPALSRYTAHAELQLRAAAVEALVHTLHSSARLRSAVLLQVVVFLAALPDEAQQVRGTRGCGQGLGLVLQSRYGTVLMW
jgi:hypothetical protein